MSGPEQRDMELERLEAALRADSPQPRPEFARELDRRVREGFPKQRPSRRLSPPSLWPALAAATTLIVVAAVAISVSGGGGGEHAISSALKAEPEPAPVLERGQQPLMGAIRPGDAATAAEPRRVERDVRLTLAAPRDELQKAADGIGVVAEDHGGFVQGSHVTTGDAGSSGGSFDLRVPQRELESTIADLSKLGKVRSRSENGRDVTGPYNSVQRRLGNALVERRTLKLRLKRAKGKAADEIRLRIDALNGAIDTLNARLDDLRRRTVYSKVSVELEALKESSGGTGAAFDDARRILEGMLNFTVRALAVLLPLGLLAALAAFGARVLRKRRREAALM